MTPRRAALTALLLPGLCACARGAEEQTATFAQEAAAEPTAHVYRVRGVLAALPDAAAGDPLIHLRHEAIPDFVGPGGEIEGMKSMTMTFEVADEIDLAGFAAGDRVTFTLEVDWSADRPAVVTAIDKLPPETRLGFE